MDNTIINVSGRMVFGELTEPGGAPGFTPNYSITFQKPKNDPEMKLLFDRMQVVAYETWDSDTAAANLAAIQTALEQGTPRQLAPSPLQDGDKDSPEFNAGTFVVKASRRVNQGAPPLFGVDGQPIVDATLAPSQGDGVIVAVTVWAMKKHSRINFTVEGVRLAQKGVSIGGPPPAVIAAALNTLSTQQLPAQIAGVQAQEQIPAQTPQAAPPVAPVAPAPLVPAVPVAAAPVETSGLFRPPVDPTSGAVDIGRFDEVEQPEEQTETEPPTPTGPTMFNLG